jgi:RecJ-like exonuclease
MNITFEITDEDLELSDHEVFMKIWDGYKSKYNYLSTSDLSEEITAFINFKRGRIPCPACDSGGMIYGTKCVACNGRGYKI